MPPIRRSSTLQPVSSQPSPTAASTPVLSLPQRSHKKKSRPTPTNKANTKLIKCVGCKISAPDSLFVAFYPKSAQDLKEQCFKCRRLNAVADFIKTHANKAGLLTLEAQLEHIRGQREAMLKWQTVLQGLGIGIPEAYLVEAMKTLTEHPALQEAKDYLAQHVDTYDPAHPYHAKAPQSPLQHQQARPDARRYTPSALRFITPSSAKPSQSPTPDRRILRLRLPHPTPAIPTSTITPSAIRSTASSLHRAANALETAYTQLSFDKLQLSQINSMFRRPFEADTIQKWADLVAESVAMEVGQRDFWKGMERSELEAVNALMRMSWDSAMDWEEQDEDEDD